ncbi:hypothetical protein TRFO_09829 [Tritrichomonas foetus]|uniref:Fucosyltransferase n=1 Tax=Tritrichomonas foetus TaxID=1144522 RepID=A0A1J4JDE1_9EUKA|nr:hypothetical protein TRFO_09829 [Tritrichomonas foetus]|eukprot:OHS96673.1 hypothetical protein TRFO_09829 [Tritrichomonas foetus]
MSHQQKKKVLRPLQRVCYISIPFFLILIYCYYALFITNQFSGTFIFLDYSVYVISVQDIPKPEFLVYHQGFNYIDPVDPKGERCLVSWDYTKDIRKAHVIVYNVLDNRGELMRPRDSSLRPDQVTVVESMESATNYHFDSNQNSFNYTMDYRLTSDVPIPYAEYFSSSEKPINLSQKVGLVAAFISNCGASNGRTNYVRELMNYIKVDSYGRCLNNAHVPSEWSNGGRDSTKEKAISHYKFTLSFENSDDDDYVTEKLYQPLRFGSVPIFRGCKQVEDFAPPNSVIDANKFASPEELAKYLHYLDKNDTAYNEYLEWKNTGNLGSLVKARFFRDRFEYGVCALLERMKNLWINPYLIDWKRKVNTSLGCVKCLDDFDLSLRRTPFLKNGTSTSYTLPKASIRGKLIETASFTTNRDSPIKKSSKSQDKKLIVANKFLSFFSPVI